MHLITICQLTYVKWHVSTINRCHMSTNICQLTVKFLRHKVLKIIQSGGFFGSLLSKLAGPLIKVVVIFTKNILAPLGITAAAAAIDAGIKKNMVQGQ